MITMLHTGGGISALHGKEIFHGILKEVVWHAFLDTLKIAGFLFLTYLIMEIIEHKAAKSLGGFVRKAGKLGPAIGGALGAVPQCGFSAVAANFYTGHVISLGTLIAVFLSTSDEMLPILVSGSVSIGAIFAILGYKLLCGMAVGFIIDLVLRFIRREVHEIDIDEICENDNCHCERGVFYSALHHTLTVGGFVFIVTLLINALVFVIGEDALGAILYDKPFVSHLIASVLGLVPNCAVSVVLTELCVEGFITVGTMLAGLFSGAGVGLLVLFKVNKRHKENLIILGILVASGIVFGMLADFIGFGALI